MSAQRADRLPFAAAAAAASIKGEPARSFVGIKFRLVWREGVVRLIPLDGEAGSGEAPVAAVVGAAALLHSEPGGLRRGWGGREMQGGVA